MTCKHGKEGDCQRCEYEADMAINPKAWGYWWEAVGLYEDWVPCEEPISKRHWEDYPDFFRRSPSAPDRDEWVKEKNQKKIWRNIDKQRRDEAHYSIIELDGTETGMSALRGMFPNARANELNFVIFSTSGVHGTYQTIEEAEAFLKGEDPEGYSEVTFLVVHPRLVALRYGTCEPVNQDDIDFLKRLRESSFEAVSQYFQPQLDKCATCKYNYELKGE